jgi:GNAT superfamily N-acetyltransferase
MWRVKREADVTSPRSLAARAIRFEDVTAILRLIDRAVQHDCRDHYDASQRAAVFASYAQTLFVDALGPAETIVAEQEGLLIGVGQVDPASSRLRALFVDASFQRRGVGAFLLAEVQERALRRGATRLHGAMSLNAVPFYRRAGFAPCDGPERLLAAGVWVPVLRMEKLLRP